MGLAAFLDQLDQEVEVVSLDARPAYEQVLEPLPFPSYLQARSDVGLDLLEHLWEDLQRGGGLSFQNSPYDVDSLLLFFDAARLEESRFVSGFLASRLSSWQRWVKLTGQENSRIARQVLSWVRSGVKLEFCSPFSPCQQSHPRYAANISRVRQMLAREVGPDIVEPLLAGNAPGHVHLRNKASLEMHDEFAQAQVNKMLKNGVLQVWDPALYGLPKVVSGLGIASDSKGKLRMIWDGRYVNLFVPYVKISYDSLGDAVWEIDVDAWLSATDKRAGYHAIPMHPDMYTYLAIWYKGRFYVFTALPFGLANACWVYESTMSVVYHPLRCLGQRLFSMIDDTIYIFSSQWQAISLLPVYFLLETVLGFTFSGDKCQLAPSHSLQFLGLIIDSHAQRLFVPEEKMVRFRAKAMELLQAPSVTARQVSSVAGILASFFPAVHYAPLYVRGLYQAIQGVFSWDAAFPSPANFLLDLQFWVDNLDSMNGKLWRMEGPVYVLVGDASESGYGGYLPNRELLSPFKSSFSQQEVALMREGKLSSTLREVRNVRLMLESVLPHLENLAPNSVIVYVGDNLGCIQLLQKMRSPVDEIFAEVLAAHHLAIKHKVFLQFEWRPRTDPWLQQADALSRDVDVSQLFMHAEIVEQASCRYSVVFTVDVFAEAGTGYHHAPKFYTPFFQPGSSGVDGLLQSWVGELAWIFPPFALILRTIFKIRREKVHCCLILPRFRQAWVSEIRSLPVVEFWDLPFSRSFYLGPRVPASWKVSHPGYALRLYYIRFND